MLLLLACTTSAPPAPTPAPTPPLKTIKTALNWYPEPEFGGFYEASLSGHYAKEGLAAELIPGGPGVPVLEMLAAGKVDIAITGADDLLLRRAKGMEVVAVFAGFQNTPVGLMTHAGGPATFEEVKGKVAIEQGSPFQLFLAGKYSWGGKVELVPTTGGIGAFAADTSLVQQGYITSEPCQAKVKGIATGFLPGKDAGWNPYASLVAVRQADLEAPWVQGFVAASRAGWVGYLQDPAKANGELAKLNPNLSAEMLSCITEAQSSYVRGTDGVGVMTEARWNELARALTAVGQTVSAKGAWSSK